MCTWMSQSPTGFLPLLDLKENVWGPITQSFTPVTQITCQNTEQNSKHWSQFGRWGLIIVSPGWQVKLSSQSRERPCSTLSLWLECSDDWQATRWRHVPDIHCTSTSSMWLCLPRAVVPAAAAAAVAWQHVWQWCPTAGPAGHPSALQHCTWIK